MQDDATLTLTKPAEDGAIPAQTVYDAEPPPELLEFISQGWAAPSTVAPAPIEGAANFAARRRVLSLRFPGETLIVPTGHEKTRANDTVYRFRPGTDFYYLTGDAEADCVLVMEPLAQGGHRDVLFVEARLPKTDPTFFTNRAKGELWVGPRLGVEKSRVIYGVDEAHALDELEPRLERATGGEWRLVRGIDPALDAKLSVQDERDAEFATFLSEMRLIKEECELAELRKAVAATARGFEDVIRALPSAKTERHVEGTFNLRARVDGADVGYSTIAASGENACTLHWVHNNRILGRGDLLLLDAGVETHTLYTADITRTLPIGGTFSPVQREIYQLVLEAQRAAFAQCRPGRDFLDPHRAAMRVLAEGLERLGILPVSAEEALRDDKQLYRRYSLHGTSHMLGLDVHDCASARKEVYRYGTLKPGIVLTVEPGLYFQPDDLTVPAKYRGIGVRIEDDVAITAGGCEILSDAIPRETANVEAWMARLWSEGSHSA